MVSLLAVLIEETTSGQLIHGVILVVPLMAVVWLNRDGGLCATKRLSRYIVQQVPAQRGEIVVPGNAAFVGTMVAIGCRWNGPHAWAATLLCCLLLIGLHYSI